MPSRVTLDILRKTWPRTRQRNLRWDPPQTTLGAACRRSSTGSPSTTPPTVTSAVTTPVPRTRPVTTGRSRMPTWRQSPPSPRTQALTRWRSASHRSETSPASAWSHRSTATAWPTCSRPVRPGSTTALRCRSPSGWNSSGPCSATTAPGAAWRQGMRSPCTSAGTSTSTSAAICPAKPHSPAPARSACSRNASTPRPTPSPPTTPRTCSGRPTPTSGPACTGPSLPTARCSWRRSSPSMSPGGTA